MSAGALAAAHPPQSLSLSEAMSPCGRLSVGSSSASGASVQSAGSSSPANASCTGGCAAVISDEMLEYQLGCAKSEAACFAAAARRCIGGGIGGGIESRRGWLAPSEAWAFATGSGPRFELPAVAPDLAAAKRCIGGCTLGGCGRLAKRGMASSPKQQDKHQPTTETALLQMKEELMNKHCVKNLL